MKKYQLTGFKIKHRGRTLSRIEALKSFTTVCGHKVNAGDLGGWIEKESNLSQDGRAWVSDEAKVFDDARVSDNAWVFGDAEVFGKAKVFGNARVYDNAWVCDKAWVYGSAVVCDDAWVYGNTEVCGDTKLCEDAKVFLSSHIFNAASIGKNHSPCTFFRTKDEGIGVTFNGAYHSLEAFLTLISRWDSKYKAPAESVVKTAEAQIKLTRKPKGVTMHFDDLIRTGDDVSALICFTDEYYNAAKIGGTRKALLDRIAATLTPKKVESFDTCINPPIADGACPSCYRFLDRVLYGYSTGIGEIAEQTDAYEIDCHYCPNCGQKLEWSAEKCELLTESKINEWVSDPEVSLEDMYSRATDCGYTNCIVERRETLMEYIHDNIKRNMKVAPLLESIENGAWADFYVFDVTGCSNLPAKPIYTKEELAEILGVAV